MPHLFMSQKTKQTVEKGPKLWSDCVHPENELEHTMFPRGTASPFPGTDEV